MAANVRKGVAEGRSDAVPIFLQDIPRLFFDGIYKPNVSMINVSIKLFTRPPMLRLLRST